jgi:hypothetical protein
MKKNKRNLKKAHVGIVVDEFMRNAKPTDVFERAHKAYLKEIENWPDPYVEQARLWAKYGPQTPGAEE